jgi:hypothetical protein
MWSAGNRKLGKLGTRADGEARRGEQPVPLRARARSRPISLTLIPGSSFEECGDEGVMCPLRVELQGGGGGGGGVAAGRRLVRRQDQAEGMRRSCDSRGGVLLAEEPHNGGGVGGQRRLGQGVQRRELCERDLAVHDVPGRHGPAVGQRERPEQAVDCDDTPVRADDRVPGSPAE